LDPECITYAIEALQPEDFYSPQNSIIFEVMKEAFMENIAIDSLIVHSKLSDSKKLESIGGNLYITDLMTSVFTSANVVNYIKIVKEKSLLR
jgi:replicative DNA helicase